MHMKINNRPVNRHNLLSYQNFNYSLSALNQYRIVPLQHCEQLYMIFNNSIYKYPQSLSLHTRCLTTKIAKDCLFSLLLKIVSPRSKVCMKTLKYKYDVKCFGVFDCSSSSIHVHKLCCFLVL